ncbi:MAG TPA: ATP synthase F1 subunit delta [Blastocatellia bacterium]|nr:ATP synthase F1 subunit delta [Blastocatellia bacterium]
MSATTVARRYAEAMADVAIARNQVDQIDAELRTFAEMLRQSRELAQVFASPVLPQADKGKVLEALIARTRPGTFTANLLRTMLTNYRLPLVAEVYEQYRRIINERRGVVVAEVTTAQPLAQAEQAQLGQRLQAITGKRVEFQFKTDPALIGGVVTRIGSVIYDGSVRTQLQEIEQRLKTGTRD